MKILFTLFLLSIIIMPFAQNKSWVCLKEDGTEAFSLEAKYVYNFSDGLAPVKIAEVVDNKWTSSIGFVDINGKLVVPCRYSKVKGKGFVNGRAWVKEKGDKFWTLINSSGERIPTGNYEKVGYIHEINGDLLCVYKGDYLGFINRDGREVIPTKYIGGTTFHEGLACVSTGVGNQGYGFIDQKGKIVIPMQFKQAGISTFMSNGMCRAGLNGKTVLIDKSGNVVFKTNKGNIQGMSNNWIRVFTKDDRTGWGYITQEDDWVIKPTYDDLEEIHADGRIAAQKNGLWGIIDTEENVLLDFKYESLYFDPEEDGYIMGAYPTDEPTSLMNTPKDYFTSDLKAVDMTGIKYIYPANNGKLMPFQAENGMKGYLDRNFQIVVKAQYKKAAAFSSNRAWAQKE